MVGPNPPNAPVITADLHLMRAYVVLQVYVQQRLNPGNMVLIFHREEQLHPVV